MTTTSKYVDIVSGTASYSFGSLYNGVSFVWGTPDYYNTITFFTTGLTKTWDRITGNSEAGPFELE